jgi:hypothetical protein
MITWIQTSFGKHHKLLLGSLLGVTIISFVFFGAWSGASGGRASNTYLGVDLNSRRELGPFYDLAAVINAKDVSLLIFYKHLADTAQIPAPSDAQLLDFYKSELGAGDLNAAAARRSQVALMLQQRSQNAPGTPAENAARVDDAFRQLWRIQALLKQYAGPDFAANYEGTLRWRTENTKWSIETATLSGAGFDPAVATPDDKLKRYFADHKPDFKIKPQILAAAVVFTAKPEDSKPAANEQQPADADLRTFATNYPEIVKATFPKFDLLKFDDQLKTDRAQILAAYNTAKAPLDRLGGRITEWLDRKLPTSELTGYESAKRILIAEGATFAEPPAFDEDRVPTDAKASGITIPATLFKAALKLSREEWRSGQYDLPLEQGKPAKVVVFLHRKTTPAREPEFAEVKTKVAAAYTLAQKATLRDERDIAAWRKLDEALRAGKTFTAAANEQKLAIKNYAPFRVSSASLSEIPPDLFGVLGSLLPELRRVPEGALTPKLRNGPDTLFVRLVKRDIPEPATDADKKQVETYATEIARNASQRTGSNLLAELQNAIAPIKKADAANANDPTED